MDSSNHPERDGTAGQNAELRSEVERLRQDLAASKQNEERLRSENADMKAITESTVAAIIVRDLDGRIISWNRGAEVIYGYSASELVGQPISKLVRPGHVAEWSNWFERVNRGEVLDRVEAVTLRKDGSQVNVLISILPVKDAVGRVVRVVGLLLDINKEKRAEENSRAFAEQLEALSRKQLETEERGRARLARELHDEIGQILTHVKMNLQALPDFPQRPGLASQLDQSIANIDAAIEHVRTLSFELRPSILDDLGLAAALRFYLDQTVRNSGIATRFVNELDAPRLARDLETTIYRVVQEATTNVIRHSRARNLRVTLRQSQEEVEIEVRDDGIGFDANAMKEPTSGLGFLGLLGMQERVRLARGNMEIVSQPGMGCTVWAAFPLNQHPAEFQ